MKHQIKAGALPFAVLIMLLIITLCSMLLIAGYLNSRLYRHEEIITKLNDNIQSAANVVLVNNSLFSESDRAEIVLFNDTLNKVVVTKRHWGCFELYRLEAGYAMKSIDRQMFVGSKFNSENDPALYLVNQNKYLFAGGKASITGKCFLPGGLIKPGYIQGLGYSGEVHTRGEILKSQQRLPEISKISLEVVSRYLTGEAAEDSVLDFETVKPVLKEMNHSFAKRTLLVKTSGDMLVEACNISGNIILCAAKEIEIQSTAKLRGVIVIAPCILVKNGFKGNIQVFARDSLIIEDNCQFTYPSVIASIGDSSVIKINENVTVEGGVLQVSEESNGGYMGSVIMGKNTTSTGIIYVQGNLEFLGVNSGSVYCTNLRFRHKSTVYNNLLSNLELNSRDVPDYYFSPVFLLNGPEKGIIEWLE